MEALKEKSRSFSRSGAALVVIIVAASPGALRNIIEFAVIKSAISLA